MAGSLEPYDPTPVPDWGMKVIRECGPWKRSGPRLVLEGPCPRCKDEDGISETVPTDVWDSAAKVADIAEMENLEGDTPQEYVRCRCRQPHDKTKTNKGCGGNGLVPVVVVVP
jgi:hypothetical protein